MSSSQHACPKQQCACSEVIELTRLYRDLKCQRKRASSTTTTTTSREEDNDEESECISAEELQMTRSQAEQALGIVRTQRQGVSNLMTALREFSQKLSKQEETLCQTDKEIAELREEMRRIREQYDKSNDNQPDDAIAAEEVAWRQALDSEVREQCRLKDKIKQLTGELEICRQRERGVDQARQDERRIDAKLLLDAMDCVEKCVEKCQNV